MKIVYETDLIGSVLIFSTYGCPKLPEAFSNTSPKRKFFYVKELLRTGMFNYISLQTTSLFLVLSASNLNISKDSANRQAIKLGKVFSVSVKNPFEISLSD